jgi:xanthine dehydrogenase YagT iron-sulfur-binding subunit
LQPVRTFVEVTWIVGCDAVRGEIEGGGGRNTVSGLKDDGTASAVDTWFRLPRLFALASSRRDVAGCVGTLGVGLRHTGQTVAKISNCSLTHAAQERKLPACTGAVRGALAPALPGEDVSPVVFAGFAYKQPAGGNTPMQDPGLYDPTRSDESAELDAGGVSRRAFLKGSGAAAAVTALTTPIADAVAQQPKGAKTLGPDPVAITLTVNDEKKQLKVEPRVTLLDALRNHLDLTGAKKVCDRATCGACTVIIDGKPAYACSVLAIEAQGREIKTVEGLGENHAMVQAFANHDAEQCGFCTPGFVVACTALLAKHRNPTLEDIEHGLGGNLCRCGTYMGIKGAVLEAAKAVAAKGGSINA